MFYEINRFHFSANHKEKNISITIYNINKEIKPTAWYIYMTVIKAKTMSLNELNGP